MTRIAFATACSLCASTLLAAQSPGDGLARLLSAELDRFPANAGIYVKHLGTGEEAAVRGDEDFSSASVIKIPIMIRALQLVDEGSLSLDERVEIRREHLRDGSGILQYHDLGQQPTIRDLITEMVITSDNTATDIMTLRVGGVDRLNAWLESSGFARTKMIGRGFEYRRKLLALLDPELTDITPEETTGLMYAMQGDPLFALYEPLFEGARARWVSLVTDPESRRRLGQNRNRLTVEDRAYWLGSMTPRETGRLLEAIERCTMTSQAGCDLMRTVLRRQQAGARRLPHFLTVPVGHKTGDSAVIANDVGMIYARSGTILVACFVNGIVGLTGEAEDHVGRVAQRIVDYFDGDAGR